MMMMMMMMIVIMLMMMMINNNKIFIMQKIKFFKRQDKQLRHHRHELMTRINDSCQYPPSRSTCLKILLTYSCEDWMFMRLSTPITCKYVVMCLKLTFSCVTNTRCHLKHPLSCVTAHCSASKYIKPTVQRANTLAYQGSHQGNQFLS